MLNKNLIIRVVTVLLFITPQFAHSGTCNATYPATTPDQRFNLIKDSSNQTIRAVEDTQTQLIWARCLTGLSGSDCSTGTAKKLSWQNALKTANRSTLLGWHDWRLPNIKELQTLIEEKCYNPAINMTIFPNTPSHLVWSSTPSLKEDQKHAWGINFIHGEPFDPFIHSSQSIRLVRTQK